MPRGRGLGCTINIRRLPSAAFWELGMLLTGRSPEAQCGTAGCRKSSCSRENATTRCIASRRSSCCFFKKASRPRGPPRKPRSAKTTRRASASGALCASGGRPRPAGGAVPAPGRPKTWKAAVTRSGIRLKPAVDVRDAVTSGAGRYVYPATAGRCMKTGTSGKTERGSTTSCQLVK